MDSLIISGLHRGYRRIVVGLAAIAACAFVLALALPRMSVPQEVALGCAGIAAFALCLLRVVHFPQDRLPWALLAAGVGLRVMGGLIESSATPPDLMELGAWIQVASFLPLYASIGLLVSRQLSDPGSSFWLDGLIAVLSISATVAAFLLQPLADAGPASPSAITMGLAVPIGDLILLSMIVGLFSLSRWRPGAVWTALAVALIASFFGAVVAVREITLTGAEYSVVPEIFALFALLAFAVAAWHRPSPRQAPRRGRSVELMVPAIVLVASTLVLTWDHFSSLGTPAVLLATGALAAVVARGFWTLRDLRSLAAMRREAMTDDLTGLPNRRSLYQSLEASTVVGSASDGRLALMLFDLDRFKDVNDALGHDAGDRLLALVAERLLETTRGSDIVARIGGDEFALLCEAESEAEAVQVAERLAATFGRPFDLGGAEIHVEVSVGVAIFPDHAHDSSKLLRRADLAMYYAKETRVGQAVFSPDRDESRLDRVGLVTEIENALADGQLEIFYQPQISLDSMELHGAEALLRWRHPSRGLLGPEEFLTVIQPTGLMRKVTRYVLTACIQQAAAWWREGRPLQVSVNLSPTDLLDARIVDDLASLLNEHDLPPELLLIEITEEAAIQDLQRGLENLVRFKSLGVEIALDDFGTGQSSLANLKTMPVDELKIDRSFLLEYSADPRDAAFVTAAVEFGRTLGLRVVAEGVESGSAVDLLQSIECDAIQGFLVSRALSAQAFDLWRDNWQPTSLALGATPMTQA